MSDYSRFFSKVANKGFKTKIINENTINLHDNKTNELKIVTYSNRFKSSDNKINIKSYRIVLFLDDNDCYNLSYDFDNSRKLNKFRSEIMVYLNNTYNRKSDKISNQDKYNEIIEFIKSKVKDTTN